MELLYALMIVVASFSFAALGAFLVDRLLKKEAERFKPPSSVAAIVDMQQRQFEMHRKYWDAQYEALSGMSPLQDYLAYPSYDSQHKPQNVYRYRVSATNYPAALPTLPPEPATVEPARIADDCVRAPGPETEQEKRARIKKLLNKAR